LRASFADLASAPLAVRARQLRCRLAQRPITVDEALAVAKTPPALAEQARHVTTVPWSRQQSSGEFSRIERRGSGPAGIEISSTLPASRAHRLTSPWFERD
jgi:hypothetical protein